MVLDLLCAAMPRINERLTRERKEAEESKQEKECDQRRRRRHQWTVRIAVFLGTLVIMGLLAFAWYKRTESHQVRLLDGVEVNLHEGKLASISPESETELGEILAAHRADPGRTPSAVRAAIGDLESTYGEAGPRLAREPLLEAAYGENIARLQSLVSRFDPAVTEPWRQKLLPLLAARGEFLADWFGTERKDRPARTSFLNESAKRFLGAGDRAFSSLLAAQSTKEKEAEVTSWQARIDADADVASRLATLQKLLASTLAERDPELSRLARKALAGHLVVTILKRQENGLMREKLLTPLAPDLAKLGDGEVRFEVLSRDLLACGDKEECESRQGVVQSAITESDKTAANWSSEVDNFLRNLLLDLPLEGRSEVWGALAQALSGAYLFSSREDAWPNGLLPLAATLLPRCIAKSRPTGNLIERISRHPIYEGELFYLSDGLTAMATSHQVVPIYSTLLSALAEQGSLLLTSGLAAVGQQVSSALANHTGSRGAARRNRARDRGSSGARAVGQQSAYAGRLRRCLRRGAP